MKRRATAFMLVWAYVACALWLPYADNYQNVALYLFPPGYFFLVGGFLGVISEWLCQRWSRFWVLLPLIALSWELGIGLYAWRLIGLDLGAIFVLATLSGSLLASWLTRYSTVLFLGGLLGVTLCATWLLTL